MKKLFAYIVSVAILAGCAGGTGTPSGTLGAEADIFPDYKNVVIPPEIAPMDFCMKDSAEYFLEIKCEGQTIGVRSKKGNFVIPPSKWKRMLDAAKGSDLEFTISRLVEGKWLSYNPFTVHIANEPAEPYLVYRLIAPGYGMWRKMGIYQRDIRSYTQTPVYENSLTDDNCVNCHSFPSRDPSAMVFHLRAKYGGTAKVINGKVEKLNTKTSRTISNLVYPYWHPDRRYIAFSVNSTFQAFHYHNPNRIEVYDTQSDVVVYDTEKGEVFSDSLSLKSPDRFETFPTFSPDGKSLYFCSAPAVDSLPDNFSKVHYSLCRIDFDPSSATFGSQVDTLFNAGDSLSASFPRVSPDGKFLVFTRHEYGNFSIWHKDADLYCINLSTGEIYPFDEANSDDVDSYHSWSGNSRWLAFSSRRLDGLYTRPFLTYVDEEGRAHKPFLLPQKNPKKYYQELMFSYNIPEQVSGKVRVNRHRIASEMKNSPGTDLKFRGE